MTSRRRFVRLATALIGAVAFVFAIGTFSKSQQSAAADAQEAKAVISKMAENAMSLMRDTSMSPEARVKKLRGILNEGFHVEAIGRFVLGRYWRSASKEDRERFLELFQDFIVETFHFRFKEYADQTFEVTDAREAERNTVDVVSKITSPDGSAFTSTWKLRDFRGAGFKVVDVYVQGVSLGITQRSEFGTVAEREGGVSGLLSILDKKVSQLRDANGTST